MIRILAIIAGVLLFIGCSADGWVQDTQNKPEPLLWDRLDSGYYYAIVQSTPPQIPDPVLSVQLDSAGGWVGYKDSSTGRWVWSTALSIPVPPGGPLEVAIVSIQIPASRPILLYD